MWSKGSDTSSKGVLDFIHFYICVPMQMEFISGCSYFLNLIDDYSKGTRIYFLKAKDKVFCQFQEFKSLMDNYTRKKIKVLRLVSGGIILPMSSKVSARE